MRNITEVWNEGDYAPDSIAVALDSERFPSGIIEGPLNEAQQAWAGEYERVARLLHSDPAPWLDDHEAEFCSGIGQYHSNEPDAKKRVPYLGITLKQIRAMVDNPPSVQKADGQWLISSTLKSRSHKLQETDGAFGLLWADIDFPKKPLADYIATIRLIVGGNYETYTSRSATVDRQKFRIIVPLAIRLAGEQWEQCQTLLALALKNHGIEPDMAARRHGQLCFLPNRGEFYQAFHERTQGDINPPVDWAVGIRNLKSANERIASQKEAEREAARLAQETRRACFGPLEGEHIIQSFKAQYGIEEQLLAYGYERKGEDWRHPKSESGSYSLMVKDGVAFSLSPNDPLWTGGAGGKAHDSFSVFVTLTHGGDIKKAIRSLRGHQ